ncbi:GOLPH3/VPS74 family protein [Actinomycetospora straminea]|uniref:GOLPH3/VPS74 family protein n=1 Tax=Actinomycetospora straminea TaxID=663607 RepID=UPI0023654A99|nr:GPP34 family phosphoprotein [Actinomycetospora straminea]MDD7936266.1 GPP34 family phosphoprotein [Actinomycetospora straminea]
MQEGDVAPALGHHRRARVARGVAGDGLDRGAHVRVIPAADGPHASPPRDGGGRERLPADASPKSAIEKLQGQVLDPLMAGLVHDGALRLEERAFLGIPRSPRYPAADRTRRDAAVARLRAVLVDGAAPTQDDAALVALVRAVKAEDKLLDAPRRELRDRSKVIAEGEWAGEAVRRAIADVHAAVAAAAGAGAVAASS